MISSKRKLGPAAFGRELNKVTEDARGLICTSVDDCRVSLSFYQRSSLHVLEEAAAFMGKFSDQSTKLKMLQAKIKRLAKT